MNGSASRAISSAEASTRSPTSSLNQQITNNNFNLNASMSIFEGFQLMNTLRQSKLNYMASRADLDKIRNDIALNVATAYLQVLCNEDLVGVAEGQLESSRQQRDRAKRQYELPVPSRSRVTWIWSPSSPPMTLNPGERNARNWHNPAFP